ncbi:hypothetical protein SSX86_006219 [Deinandra increscens subsp. villosa]|uniref:Phytocyanin domain-containing protein n=1 Tax=Deinandra increscens subsp. villosa TaxID=3103831 RepID=A0AAP0HAK1_9ASTR
MASHTSLSFLLVFFIASTSPSHARTFEVGGQSGWTLRPSEPYSNWSSRLRFLINDTLHFKYDGGSDSVVVVNRSGYDGCDFSDPIMKLEGGDSVFKFDRSGPFYFVTGNKSNCDQGQKLIVVVLALRNRSPPPSVATPPSPVAVSPSLAVSPELPPSPAISPELPPSPAISPELPPSPAVSPELPPSPTVSPELPPSPSGVGSAPSPGGGGGPGGGAPTPGGGGGGPSSGGNNPSADTTSPPPPSVAAPPLSGVIIASLITIIVTLCGIY